MFVFIEVGLDFRVIGLENEGIDPNEARKSLGRSTLGGSLLSGLYSNEKR